MSQGTQGARPCPLCGSRGLAPVFYPPLVRCGGCGLVFRNVQAAEAQVKGGFEAIYATLALEQHVQDRRGGLYREFLARYRPAPGRNRLLDVGCGIGQFLTRAREWGWDVTGVEIAEAGAATARAAGLPVWQGSLRTAPLRESSFDAVTFWNVLDFMPDPMEQVVAAKRLLAPGGILAARVANLPFHAAVYRASRRLRRWPGLAAMLGRQCFFSQVSFNARTLRQTLEQAGFEEIEIANSLPSEGDPYRTLPGRGDRVLQAAKRAVYGLTWLIAASSRGQVLLGSSLWATAVNGDGVSQAEPPPAAGSRA